LVLFNTPISPTFLPLVEVDAGQQNLSEYTLKYFAYEPGQPKNVSFITRNIRNTTYRAEIANYLTSNPIFGTLDFYNDNYPRPPYAEHFNLSSFVYKMPSMILWGTEEEYFSSKTIYRIESWFAKGVRLATVPGAGHWVFKDDVEKTNREIKSFLAYLGY